MSEMPIRTGHRLFANDIPENCDPDGIWTESLREARRHATEREHIRGDLSRAYEWVGAILRVANRTVRMTQPNHDRTSVYTNSEGDTLTFAQIAMASAKDSVVDVEPVHDGYYVGGEKYTPRNQSPGDNPNP
jgi:hypothetical protein